jgi:lipopolysaccharide biosynthesis glycosyltransferase
MHAIFCVDKAGLSHFAVAATSLAIHKPKDLSRAFLLTVDVEKSYVRPFFESLSANYGLDFTLVQVPRHMFDPFPVFGHVTVGTYFRLMIGEVLPDDVSDVLYLDTDIVVHGDLELPLANAVSRLEASGHIAAAVSEESDTTRHLHEAGILEGPYLQAGVMLINLPRWKKAFSLDYFVDILNTHKKNIVWWDQDILNIALKDRWLELPRTLNGTPGNKSSDTVIYHYAGSQKPWRFKADVRDAEIYEHYRRQTQILRPPRIDPQTVVAHYTRPFRVAKKVLKKKLGLRSKKR